VPAAGHLAAHGPWRAAATVLPALALGALYQRSRSTPACVLLHAGFNLIWLGLAPLAPAWLR
jgi:membrane protease YdiL (CAAX protease family)